LFKVAKSHSHNIEGNLGTATKSTTRKPKVGKGEKKTMILAVLPLKISAKEVHLHLVVVDRIRMSRPIGILNFLFGFPLDDCTTEVVFFMNKVRRR
jgi:hypothetical protein